MKRTAAIVGVGQTAFSSRSGQTEYHLAITAIRNALADAGVAGRDVQALVRYGYDNVTHPMIVRAFGMRDVRWYADVPLGGVAQSGVLAQAKAAITSGIAELVVVWRALNERSGVRYGRAERHFDGAGDDLRAGTDRSPSGEFAAPYGYLAPGQGMAMWAARYAFEAGLDAPSFTRVLGTVAVGQRAYARRNPAAMMKDKPLDLATYAQGRMISSPLRLYDYCLESDGAVALVIAAAGLARELRPDPVWILAAQQGLYPYSEPLATYAGDLMVHAAAGNVDKLYADAGLAPADMSFAQVYDATSFLVVSDLETYGFAERGQAGRYLMEHGVGLHAPLPINTHGGHLSEGYIHGLNHVAESVRQLRGTSANQVANAQFGLLACHGASSAILGRV